MDDEIIKKLDSEIEVYKIKIKEQKNVLKALKKELRKIKNVKNSLTEITGRKKIKSAEENGQ